ncbi:MAG: hypothetical protein ACOYOK_04390 [Pseudobdellovibrionaceae bacterium]
MAKDQKNKKANKVLKKLHNAVKTVKKAVTGSAKPAKKPVSAAKSSKSAVIARSGKASDKEKHHSSKNSAHNKSHGAAKSAQGAKSGSKPLTQDYGTKDRGAKDHGKDKSGKKPDLKASKAAEVLTKSAAVKSAKAPAKGHAEPAAKDSKKPVVKTSAIVDKGADKKVEAKVEPKKDSKLSKKPKKEEAVELEDDFIADDNIGEDEIGEYEEELKAVEEADQEALEDDTVWTSELEKHPDDEIILTDAEGRRYCRARDCDQISTVDGYCRYHYLLFWKKIQVRKKILLDGKLERYVEELTSRYPDKFLEVIRRDLRTEKDFLSAIQEMEIDESAENEFEEDTQSYIEEVRGISGSDTPVVEDEEF